MVALVNADSTYNNEHPVYVRAKDGEIVHLLRG